MSTAADDARRSFFSLTPDRVLDAVEGGGRRATGYALARNSLENRVYEVEFEDGQRLVAKFYRPGRWSGDAILDEHAFLAELAAEEVPVVPPIDLRLGLGAGSGGPGSTLGELPGNIFYALFPKVRGRVPQELSDGELAQLGRLVARLHNVGGTRPAPHRPTLTPATYGTASLAILVGEAHGGPWVPMEFASRYVRAVEEIVRLAAAAWGSVQPIRLHGDCHLGNLLWGTSGPFFLDFDDFLAGPEVQDLWLIAPGHDEEALRQRALLADAYSTMRRFDTRSLRLVESLRALRIIRYSAWIAQRWQDPAFQRTFPDFPEHRYWQNEVRLVEEQVDRVRASLA